MPIAFNYPNVYSGSEFSNKSTPSFTYGPTRSVSTTAINAPIYAIASQIMPYKQLLHNNSNNDHAKLSDRSTQMSSNSAKFAKWPGRCCGA